VRVVEAVVAKIRLLLAAFFSRVMRTRFAQRFISPLFPPLHLRLYKWTGGRFNLTSLIVPSLVLETTGAKSGLKRETPLMCWPRPDGTYLVAGSNWGQEHHPAWTGNLLANPEASIVISGKHIAVKAELLVGDEREAAWAILEAQWPGYREYEATTGGRKVRIFRLVPTS